MSLAPIALFVYNRPMHTQQALDALSKNPESKNSILYIFCDGAKNINDYTEMQAIQAVQDIIHAENRFETVLINISKTNKGLAPSLIEGITSVVAKHGSIIVLEDDIICSPFFLQYMNQSLEVYLNDKDTLAIGACNYFNINKSSINTFFLPVVDTWGWATWADRWQLFEPDSHKLLQQIEEKKIKEKFDLYGIYPFYNMLQMQADGEISSWAIRWQAVAYLNNKKTLYPNPALSQHIHSNNATHAAINICPPMANAPIKVTYQKPQYDKHTFKAFLKTYYINFETNSTIIFKKLVKFSLFWLANKKRIILENTLK